MIKKLYTFEYFKYDDFADSESGANKMQLPVIRRLDLAREIAGIPFIISSGYRDENHKESLKNPTSSHIKGLAVDIFTTPQTQERIYQALLQAGFNRIGRGANFIHADMDYNKPQARTWFYDGRASINNANDLRVA